MVAQLKHAKLLHLSKFLPDRSNTAQDPIRISACLQILLSTAVEMRWTFKFRYRQVSIDYLGDYRDMSLDGIKTKEVRG